VYQSCEGHRVAVRTLTSATALGERPISQEAPSIALTLSRPSTRKRNMKQRIARPAIECAVVDHCNLSCAGCDHSSPFLPDHCIGVAEFERDATALARALHVQRLRIVGGEPLLHPELPDLLAAAQSSGLADEVELWTNGLRLHEADPAIFPHLDTLRITKYPGVRLKVDLEELARLAERHGFRLRVEACNEFLHGVLNQAIDDPAVVNTIFQDCKNTHLWSCHAFQGGRYYKCSRAPYIAKRLELKGMKSDFEALDGVSLHDTSDLHGDLERYLTQKTPLRSCNWCLGTSGERFPHHQLGRKQRAQELSALVDVQSLLQIGVPRRPSP
jgi:hypothetical protein